MNTGTEYMKMFCITHKYCPHLNNSRITPIVVGTTETCPPEWLRDNELDNIAYKNPNYCELTAQYWIWKNVFPKLQETELVGFCHYRRFFLFETSPKIGSNEAIIPDWNNDKISDFIKNNTIDVIIPEPERLPSLSLSRRMTIFRKGGAGISAFWKPSNQWLQFAMHHDIRDLKKAVSCLKGSKHQSAFEAYLNSPHRLHPYNMYIGPTPVLNEYFETLFPWLEKCEQEIEVCKNDAYQARIFGFLAERFSSYYFSQVKKSKTLPVKFIANV